MENSSTPLLVVAVALIAADGLVLMQRRPFQAVHGGLWEFPGGKVEPGETVETALVREIVEELEVALLESELEPIAFASGVTDLQGRTQPIVILLYRCFAWQGTPRCIDESAIGWFNVGQIASLAMPPLDYPLAAQLARIMESGA